MNIQELNARLAATDEEDESLEDSSQFLTFLMADEEYGVDILKVQEIRGWEQSTAIPNAPDYVKGVLNLRGTIVPVIDLRIRFGLPAIEYSPITVVIVLKLEQAGKDKIMGIVVDAVSDVHTILDSQINQSPELGDNKNSRFINGLGQAQDKMLILLNLNDVLNI
ncbi:chemotaxis protein CheW [Catenovulum sp. SM1970]|uniref:chemotaxis protein CheW n=1 Tax=Marinifaba aquimaris TaxID=2741323 RepID=UPI00157240C1|nr:chemotaxis protein CheW [Marinifaba aquimaris]NTS76515.1 chemotaxis protein CheW [Marinifaba aquimaris]